MGNKDSLSSNNDSTSFLRSFSLTSVYDSAITRPLQPESFGHFGRVRETNSSPRKIGLPNRKVVFQPSIFWSSGRVFPLLFTTHLVEKAPNNSGLWVYEAEWARYAEICPQLLTGSSSKIDLHFCTQVGPKNQSVFRGVITLISRIIW